MARDEQLSAHGIRRGDRRLMAEMNRNLVFNVLRTGATSRADVVRTSGLSPATVSAIVSELIESGLVNEIGQGKSRGGRPPLVLRINDERNYAVGVKIMGRGLFIVVTDIRAEVLYSEMVELDWAPVTDDRTLRARGAHDPVSVLDRICLAIEDAADRAGVGMGKVVGIGIGLSGLIEPRTGTCRYTPLFGWTDVQVAAPIAKRLDRPVLVENDCNALTVAEQWFGRGHGVDNFVVVAVGEGVGAGIVIDGNLYRGADGAARRDRPRAGPRSDVAMQLWALRVPRGRQLRRRRPRVRGGSHRSGREELSVRDTPVQQDDRGGARRGRRRRRDGDGRPATRRPHAWARDRRVGEPAEPKASYPFWPRGPGRAARLGSRLRIGTRALFCRYRPKYGLFCRFSRRCCLG